MFHQSIYFVVCFNNYCFSFLAFLGNNYRGWFHISCNHCLISWVDYSVGTRREKGHSPSCWRCHLWKTLQMYILQLNKHPENNHWALVKKAWSTWTLWTPVLIGRGELTHSAISCLLKLVSSEPVFSRLLTVRLLPFFNAEQHRWNEDSFGESIKKD